MAKVDITVESPKTGNRSMVITYDFGDDLNDAVEKFGAHTVFTGFQRMGAQDLGNATRRYMNELIKGTETPRYSIEEVRVKMAGFKPGVQMVRTSTPIDPISAFIAQISSMTPEQRLAEFARIQEAIANAS